eukprot:15461944-Alexandrium_andersonii.AAC.1
MVAMSTSVFLPPNGDELQVPPQDGQHLACANRHAASSSSSFPPRARGSSRACPLATTGRKKVA